MAIDLRDKRVLIVGLAKSGLAAARFVKAQGARVTASDNKTLADLLDEIPPLLAAGIAVETGGHGERTFDNQDLIVVSPGVAVDRLPFIAAHREKVIGELELAAQFFPGRIIAITGSNGKTTTTALTGQVIRNGGFPTLVGGNIGMPAISLVEEGTEDTVAVLEVSSFQLETIRTFRPHLAVVLNLTPDHLDRHGTFAAYRDAKARIFENQQADDFAVLNADDPGCVELATRTRAQVFWFSRRREPNQGAYVHEGRIFFRDSGGPREIMPVSDIPLLGAHNLENVLAAVCAGVLSDVEPRRIAKAVREFQAVEHRLEYVTSIRGVDYYNDSKATNVDATIKALESFPANIHLILGGKDKAGDYRLLTEHLRQRVKSVYTIGAAAPKIESQIQGVTEVVQAETLENAIRRAAAAALAGDIVLLAPACASFDQFRNFEHRGAVFKEVVRALAAEVDARGEEPPNQVHQ
ncbi:MAG TPA: UDP-N-acetylmuramoyl-L-alanine--D-glutamate ligase [Terriglobales bacterium]|nr:UDP-N-acetylmuramoyl-L-alanine--D-glutamate ligase [Terriglobales bacterium]